MKNYEICILFGGKGERLKPITNNVPKPLVKINNKTILSYIIDHFLMFIKQLEEYEKIKKQFSGKSSKGEIDIQYMNYDKLNKLFNWSPVTNFDDSINKTISLLKDYWSRN